jgi:peptide/nickel transport system substrate-binding protein
MRQPESIRLMSSRSAVRRSWGWAAAALLTLSCLAATRPHYGGTLRVEVREPIETPDPPDTGPTFAQLRGGFAVTRWEAGHRAVYTADENAPSGRPFLDSIDVQMARPLRERAIELGRADVVELAPNELRRVPAGQRIWSSSPVRVVALVFGPRIEDVRVREALALAVDRAAIHNVLLQRQGEISGALVPQWISGYAFLFPAAADLPRARSLVAALPAATRSLTLAADDKALADRIALNARDAGLAVTSAPLHAADVRLIQLRIVSSDPARALAGIAAALGAPEPPHPNTPEGLLAAERTLIEGFRVIPLFHLPDLYSVAPRVKGGPGVTPLGEWRFENLWIEGGRP